MGEAIYLKLENLGDMLHYIGKYEEARIVRAVARRAKSADLRSYEELERQIEIAEVTLDEVAE